MQRAVKNSAALQSKLEQIKTGAVKKTDLGTKSNQNVVQGKGGKYQVFETEKKFEEAGVRRKKRNYVLYESKLGTEKQTNLKKIEEPKPAPKPKPKPVPVARPRMEEKIITQKKRKEYLDNYQYHESKVIRRPDPNRVSIVSHKRLSDIIGGFYEEMTYQRQTMNDLQEEAPPPPPEPFLPNLAIIEKRPMLEMYLAEIRKELKLPLPQLLLLLKLQLLDQARDHKMEEVLLPLLKKL